MAGVEGARGREGGTAGEVLKAQVKDFAFVLIAIMERIPDWKETQEKYCFEIAMSILMAGWIMHNGW